MQLKVVCHITNRKTTENAGFFFFQFLKFPLIYGDKKQNLYFLSYDNVFKYTVKYPMH